MDHIVYLDVKAKELENLLAGTKSMIIRGATGRKLPHGRVKEGDVLYFVRNNGEGLVQACAVVKHAFHSDQLTPEESQQMVQDNQPKLQLNDGLLKRFAGKRYLVLIEVEQVQALDPFSFDRSAYGNMDDWLPVETIDSVRAA